MISSIFVYFALCYHNIILTKKISTNIFLHMFFFLHFFFLLESSETYTIKNDQNRSKKNLCCDFDDNFLAYVSDDSKKKQFKKNVNKKNLEKKSLKKNCVREASPPTYPSEA